MPRTLAVRILVSLLFVGLVAVSAGGCKKKSPTESSYCEDTGNC